ncbi:MAG: DUF2147 domain-containing protein [Sphingorhabdus sp.]
MPSRKMLVSSVAAVFLASLASAAAPIDGRWLTESKDAIVEIGACGTSVCGKIAKFLVTPPQGVGQKDIHNPKPALRNRTVLGMTILTGFKADGKIWRGMIYDPKTGKSYRSIVSKAANGKLIVKGCIGPFCQAQAWTAAR